MSIGLLLSIYSEGIYESIRRLVATDRALPEPELEHPYNVLLAFDAGTKALPDYVRSLKIDVVRRLIDFYYEGHPAEEKRKAPERLAGVVE